MTFATQGAEGPARIRAAGQDVDLAVPDCFWSGTGVEIWQESNGIPGLQPHTHGGCVTDTIVLGAQAAAVTRCVL